MRWLWGLLLGLTLVWWPAPAFAACPFYDLSLQSITQNAKLVVVATVTEIKENQAMFKVDSFIKGTLPLPENDLEVLNHQIHSDENCQLSLGDGDRFAVGSRWVLLLEPSSLDPNVIWQAANIDANGAFSVEADQVTYTEQGLTQTIALSELTTLLTNYRNADQQALVMPHKAVVAPRIGPIQGFDQPQAIVDSAPDPNRSNRLAWVLVGIGVVAALGTVIGWRRSRTN